MNCLNKIKPTKGDAYIKGNALPESDYEPATGRALYTITAMRKAYDAGQRDEREARPEREPVALQYPQKNIDWQREQQIKAQASSPPQRPWVGLTEKERLAIMRRPSGTERGLAVLIEAKLKEKNE